MKNVIEFVSKCYVPVVGWVGVIAICFFYVAFVISQLMKLARWLDKRMKW